MNSTDFLNMLQRGSAIPAMINAVRIDAGDGRVATLTRGGEEDWNVEIFYGDEVPPKPTPREHLLRVLDRGEK